MQKLHPKWPLGYSNTVVINKNAEGQITSSHYCWRMVTEKSALILSYNDSLGLLVHEKEALRQNLLNEFDLIMCIETLPQHRKQWQCSLLNMENSATIHTQDYSREEWLIVRRFLYGALMAYEKPEALSDKLFFQTADYGQRYLRMLRMADILKISLVHELSKTGNYAIFTIELPQEPTLQLFLDAIAAYKIFSPPIRQN